jgi:hypothetical protein
LYTLSNANHPEHALAWHIFTAQAELIERILSLSNIEQWISVEEVKKLISFPSSRNPTYRPQPTMFAVKSTTIGIVASLYLSSKTPTNLLLPKGTTYPLLELLILAMVLLFRVFNLSLPQYLHLTPAQLSV